MSIEFTKTTRDGLVTAIERIIPAGIPWVLAVDSSAAELPDETSRPRIRIAVPPLQGPATTRGVLEAACDTQRGVVVVPPAPPAEAVDA